MRTIVKILTNSAASAEPYDELEPKDPQKGTERLVKAWC